jgi:hypothetical protein
LISPSSVFTIHFLFSVIPYAVPASTSRYIPITVCTETSFSGLIENGYSSAFSSFQFPAGANMLKTRQSRLIAPSFQGWLYMSP